MSLQRASLIIAALVTVCVVPVTGQQKLGDLVAEGGYDWIIGRWVATSDDGGKVEVKYDWVLDKHAVLCNISMGEFRYRGLVMLSPVSGEIFEAAADNQGGTWRGTWSQDAAGLVQRTEHTGSDGQVRKVELAYERAGADGVTIALYGVDSAGSRSAAPMVNLTYKRQTAAAAADSASGGPGSGSRDYQTLGDMVSEGGYTWLMGKWLATEGSQTYDVEYKPILDQHAAWTDVKIGDFQYLGLIMYVPSRQEIVQAGADSAGGTWKGTWEQDSEDALNRIEHTRADATVRRMQHVYSRLSAGGFKVKEYVVEGGGSRASTPAQELTFKPQKAATPSK